MTKHNLTPIAVHWVLQVLATAGSNSRGYMSRWPDHYCPEGVVCEAYRRATGKGKWERDAFGVGSFVIGDQDISDKPTIPTEVASWAFQRGKTFCLRDGHLQARARDLFDTGAYTLSDFEFFLAGYPGQWGITLPEEG